MGRLGDSHIARRSTRDPASRTRAQNRWACQSATIRIRVLGDRLRQASGYTAIARGTQRAFAPGQLAEALAWMAGNVTDDEPWRLEADVDGAVHCYASSCATTPLFGASETLRRLVTAPVLCHSY